MKPLTISSISLISAAVLAALPQITVAQTSTSGNALTIYSSARPGALPPELYRSGGNGQAVPGYAVVRQQRDLALNLFGLNSPPLAA